MNRNRFTVTPFNQLKLTTNDRQQLVEIADTLVSAKLEEYEEYLSNEKQVDLDRWKKFTKTGPTTMYLERKNTNPGSNLHTLLMTGLLPGTLDDNMFGLVSPTLESMRVKTSYLEDFSAGAVLATIVEPTEEEPFRSVVVKWMEIDIPGASLGVIRNRDYVYLESTGIMQLKNGESLGFHLLHSVSFPQTHERSGRVRGNMSLCAILQQDGPERTKCRGSGLMDPAGDMIRAIAVIGIVQATMAAVKYSYCGQMKKLAWLLNKQHAKARERSARVLKPECVTCLKPIKASKVTIGKSNSTCKLCFKALCGSCKVTKKLSFISLDLELTQRKVTFCVKCLMKATRMDAVEAARQQFVRKKSVYPDSSSELSSYSDESENSAEP